MSAQDEANQAAKEFACNSAAQLALLANPDAPGLIVDGVPTGPVAPGYTSPPGTHTFFNGPATCTVACADGSTTFFTTPPGRFSGASQAQADQVALSYACQQAQLGKLCLSSLDGECCLSKPAAFVVTATGATGTGSWIQTGGALPPGLTAVENNRQLVISGTPTTIGAYAFEFKCTLTSGISRTKTFSLSVMGITDTDLPAFSKNISYSFTLTASGGTAPYSFALVSGSLPPGLNLSSGGTISGTPTVDPDTYPVTIAVRDDRGTICTKLVSFSNPCVPGITPALEGNFTVSSGLSVYSIKTGTLFAVDSSDGKTLLEISTSGILLHSFSIGADTIGSLFYEDTHQRVYAGYRAGTANRLAQINPSTRTVVNSVTLASDSADTIYSAYDFLNDRLWLVNGLGDVIFVVNCSTLSASSLAITNFFPNGLTYCNPAGLMVCAGNMTTPPFNHAVAVIDALALTYSVVDLGITGLTSEVAYCTTNDRVYMTYGPGNTIKIFAPSNPAGFSSLTLTADTLGVVYNPCTDRIQVTSADNATHVITEHWIRTFDNSIVASINTGLVLSQFNPTAPWFDSSNDRVWLGTRTKLLKFT